tara:strand:- start:289 stop:477 length:189 start_codon:yes stop_codon:yes gene_type:complete
LKPELIDILACPICKKRLDLSIDKTNTDTDEIIEGTLSCSGCNEKYPIIDTIPNLLPPDLRE